MGYLAKAWGLTPLAYLRLPQRERRFCEAFLLAESLKQQAKMNTQKTQQNELSEHKEFDATANSWAAEIKRRFKRK